MPISERHRVIFDCLIMARKYINRQRPYNAKKEIDKALDELINVEVALQNKRVRFKKEFAEIE